MRSEEPEKRNADEPEERNTGEQIERNGQIDQDMVGADNAELAVEAQIRGDNEVLITRF